MPLINAVATSFPIHAIPQPLIKAAAAGAYAGKIPDLESLLAVFDHSRIAERQFIQPLEWYARPHEATERQRLFQTEGLALARQAALACLEKAGCSPQSIDHVIFVSTTGLATPSLDAYLINQLGMKPSTTRLPIWGLGCAAGAAGLSRTADYCLAHPQARVLLVALELCSLAFMSGDVSKKNMVAISLFSDGAAAVLIDGDKRGATGPQIVASRSHLFPDSYRIMGWDFVDEGMQLVLSPKLPAIVRQELKPLLESFLREQGLRRTDIVHFLTHPGGARVVDAYREALALGDEELRLTEEILRRHGNVSSVSVLAVLEEWLKEEGSRRPGYGLLSAFGPGFSAEFVLLRV